MSPALAELRRRGLLLATNNRGKLAEFTRMLVPLQIPVHSLADLGIVLDPEETGRTFQDNAAIKARAFFQAAQIPVLSDDSGLCVSALGGAPGVWSARYGGPDLDDAGRRQALLAALADPGLRDRAAYFACVLALTLDGSQVYFFEGRAHGRIALEEKGTGGFGYDPIFVDPASGLHFAELSAADKDRLSHRGAALRRLLTFLN